MLGKMLFATWNAAPSMPIPQGVKQVGEVWGNKNIFTGLPIESRGDEFKAPEDRFNQYTSETMVQLAESMPTDAPEWMRSPKQLEHIYRGFTGTLGAYVMDTADVYTRRGFDFPDAPKTHWRDAPILKNVIGRYWRSTDAKSSSYVSEYYKLLQTSEKLVKSVEHEHGKGNFEEEQKLRTENARALAMVKPMKKTQQTLSTIKKQINKVFTDPRMGADEKRERLNRLTEKRNTVAQRAVKAFKQPGA